MTVWVERLEDLGLLIVISTSLAWLAFGFVALVDGLLSGFTNLIVAVAQPGQWFLPLAGIGVVLQVFPRALTTTPPTQDRGPWRVQWPAIFFTLLAVVFFSAAWVALFGSMFAGSLYTSLGNMIFYFSLATVAGALATLSWASVSLFRPRDWESWTDLSEPPAED